jgi:hypothetical protein
MMTADFDKHFSNDFWLQGTMALLKVCDAVVLHARWESSRGAVAERAEALAWDMPVFDTRMSTWQVQFTAWCERVTA